MVGAILAFGFGVLYSWLQTIMSFKMIPLVNTKHVACLRLVLSMIMTCTFATSSVCGPMAFRRFHGKDPTVWNRKFDRTSFRSWRVTGSNSGNDGGWDLHIASTVCEWISALSLDFFILTFAREFHSISLTSPRVMFVVERLSLPTLESNPMNYPKL